MFASSVFLHHRTISLEVRMGVQTVISPQQSVEVITCRAPNPTNGRKDTNEHGGDGQVAESAALRWLEIEGTRPPALFSPAAKMLQSTWPTKAVGRQVVRREGANSTRPAAVGLSTVPPGLDAQAGGPDLPSRVNHHHCRAWLGRGTQKRVTHQTPSWSPGLHFIKSSANLKTSPFDRIDSERKATTGTISQAPRAQVTSEKISVTSICGSSVEEFHNTQYLKKLAWPPPIHCRAREWNKGQAVFGPFWRGYWWVASELRQSCKYMPKYLWYPDVVHGPIVQPTHSALFTTVLATLGLSPSVGASLLCCGSPPPAGPWFPFPPGASLHLSIPKHARFDSLVLRFWERRSLRPTAFAAAVSRRWSGSSPRFRFPSNSLAEPTNRPIDRLHRMTSPAIDPLPAPSTGELIVDFPTCCSNSTIGDPAAAVGNSKGESLLPVSSLAVNLVGNDELAG
ncbi:hypothetical protein QBC35DRAFT_543400 [Podospora australis]|uniref:Uncharacterized protein n=1 Tax=Podospora australis TaxID=1536484 RepID=A0AAN7APA5_9PEZI|nr:hypothetical protein QBC35DRAFT_543400 [Podospora australis]